MKITVLGAGLVGGPMAVDLARDPVFDVSVVDVDAAKLDKIPPNLSILKSQLDLSVPRAVADAVSQSDMVVNAVPGSLGFATLKEIIAAGKNVVDIAFYPEDPLSLDGLAKDKGVIAIVDCGVAPGMNGILTAYSAARLDRAESAVTYVGGLPEVRQWPYEYKAVFSPADVIEEYVRPARYVENGKVVTRPALSEPEFLDFPGVGTLEAFNTDGLRTMLATMDIPNMKEKTLRYPGHIAKMALLRETGFFSEDAIEVGGVAVIPRDVTASLLFPKWRLGEDESDITVMQVMVQGCLNGGRRRYRYDLYDRYDAPSGVHSMARTTGYTATMAARLIAGGLYDCAGISPPEYIGRRPACVEFMLDGLEERGVLYRETVEDFVAVDCPSG